MHDPDAASPPPRPFPPSGPPPVPGRECGGCNVCCVVLTIDDPELRKVQGVRCTNALPDNRCGIYDGRPGTCRTFLCGWRAFKWVRTSRPELSGVLVRASMRPVEGAARPEETIVVTILRETGLAADGLAETIAAVVAAGRPLFLEVLGRPGQTYGIARIDEVLSDAVRRRDRPGLLGTAARLLGGRQPRTMARRHDPACHPQLIGRAASPGAPGAARPARACPAPHPPAPLRSRRSAGG